MRTPPLISPKDLGAGTGFGESATNKTVEDAAITFVTDVYYSEGWLVTSVEQERCGYDLHCTNDKEELHVEVKGLSGDFGPFIIIAGEANRAGTDPMFVLCVVARATSPRPELHTYTHSDLVSVHGAQALSETLTAFRIGAELICEMDVLL